jgi:hypothetical protein
VEVWIENARPAFTGSTSTRRAIARPRRLVGRGPFPTRPATRTPGRRTRSPQRRLATTVGADGKGHEVTTDMLTVGRGPTVWSARVVVPRES